MGTGTWAVVGARLTLQSRRLAILQRVFMNAFQFVHLHTLLVLMLIGAERALGIILGPEYVTHGHKYLSGLRITGF